MAAKKVTLKMDSAVAEHVRKILSDHTAPYSTTFPPERVVQLREVLTDLEGQLG